MRRLLVVSLALAACSSDPGQAPLDLSARLSPGQARAGRVEKATDLIGGPTAEGAAGDFKLYNSRIAVIVEAPGPSNGYDTYGGFIVDADVVRPAGEPGRSSFGEAIQLYNLRTPRGTSAEVVNDGRDGKAAVVRVKAVDASFPLVESVLGQSRGEMGLDLTMDYVLEPDANYVRIVTTMVNRGTEDINVSDHFVGYVMGDGLQQFLRGHGFDLPTIPQKAPYFGAASEDVSYTFLSPESDFTPQITFEGFLMGQLSSFWLAPGVDNVVESVVVVGDGDLAAHEVVHEALLKAAGRTVEPTHALTGTVADAAGTKVAKARVHVRKETKDEYVIQARTGADGAFSLRLPAGTYRVRATADGRDAGEEKTVTVPGAAAVALDVSRTGALVVKATEGGAPVPVKIMAKRAESPSRVPASFGVDERPRGFERVEFLEPSEQRLAVPPGEWLLQFSRGVEYEVVEKRVTVAAGADAVVDVPMVRSVDSTGFVCGDFHIHSQYSADSDDLVEHKVRAIAAEGIEVPVSTEHEHIGDLGPIVEKLGLGRWVKTIVGEEVSTTVLGHFNAFPLARDPLLPNFGAFEWFGVKGDDLFKKMRGNAARPLVQVNHPRSGSFGAPFIKGYFSAVGFEPSDFSVRDPYDWSIDYDSLEIANSGTPDYEDWFAFLDRGLKMLATGDSDTHDARVDAVGYPRNCVRAGTDAPAELTVDAFMAALRAGKVTVSGGFLVDASAGEHGLGALVPASAIIDGSLSIQVKVQAPKWVGASKLELVMDGNVIASRDLPDGEAGVVRFADAIEVELPQGRDAWIIARVSGGRLAYDYPGSEAFGFTNPIFVDVNGTGSFEGRLPLP